MLVMFVTPAKQHHVQVRARLTGGEGPWSDPATLTLSDTVEPLIDTSSVSPNTSVPGALLLNLAEIIPEVFQRPGIRWVLLLSQFGFCLASRFVLCLKLQKPRSFNAMRLRYNVIALH